MLTVELQNDTFHCCIYDLFDLPRTHIDYSKGFREREKDYITKQIFLKILIPVLFEKQMCPKEHSLGQIQ